MRVEQGCVSPTRVRVSPPLLLCCLSKYSSIAEVKKTHWSVNDNYCNGGRMKEAAM